MTTYIYNVIILILSISGSKQWQIELKERPQYFTVDNIGNIYVLGKNQLSKYSFDGKLLSQYSTFKYGQPEFIDTTDPFKLLLYYKNDNTVLLLDNKLNQLGSAIILSDTGLMNVQNVCKSRENSIWAYDNYLNSLINIDLTTRKHKHIINLDVWKTDIKIDFMKEYGNQLHIAEYGDKLRIIDIYSNIITEKELEIQSNSFQFFAGKFYFHNHLLLFQINSNFENIDSKRFENISWYDDIKVTNDYYVILRPVYSNK